MGTRLRVEAPHKAEELLLWVQDLPREQTGSGRPGEESDPGQWEMVSGVVRRLSDSSQHTGPAGLSGWAHSLGWVQGVASLCFVPGACRQHLLLSS